jgi:hypothetical protein
MSLFNAGNPEEQLITQSFGILILLRYPMAEAYLAIILPIEDQPLILIVSS